ncbi:hypothetical protein N7522_002988 [Penicillium canescens]|nr:hypothetical protein N7522_002988 [Penicillium canescens]
MPDPSLNRRDEACLAHCIARLGSLNKRCLTWVYNSRGINPYFAHGTNESASVMDCVGNDWLLHLLVGRDIVEEGFRVRDVIFNLAPSLSPERNVGRERHVDFIMPFYHCGLVGISRFFIDPVWQLLGDELPLLSEETIESHSLVALSYIEERLTKVNLDLDTGTKLTDHSGKVLGRVKTLMPSFFAYLMNKPKSRLLHMGSDSQYVGVEILLNMTKSHSYGDNKLHDWMLANASARRAME